MLGHTSPLSASLHLQCLTSACSGRAPTVCTRPSPAARRPFHGTRSLRDEIDDKNHYETLNLKTNATPAEIKKSFYTLSKTHHPDHNRADPHASRRFMRISEAYTTLSHTTSREKYDRNVLRLHEQASSSRSSHHHPRGSYHSSQTHGPAGGRPASGLSRRRGTFRGPPPSFYRSGGWGAHGAKRSAAHEDSTGGGGSSGSHSTSSSSSSSSSASSRPEEEQARGFGAGGMGPGQAPPGGGRGGAAAGSEVPHFDRYAKEAHTRRQERLREVARAMVRRDRRAEKEKERSSLEKMFVVATILGIGMGIPFLVLGQVFGVSAGPEKSKKAY